MKDEKDIRLKQLKSYKQNIKLTAKTISTKFADAKLICFNSIYKFEQHIIVNRESRKLPKHQLSKVPKHFQRNTVFGDDQRAKTMPKVFDADVSYVIG